MDVFTGQVIDIHIQKSYLYFKYASQLDPFLPIPSFNS